MGRRGSEVVGGVHHQQSAALVRKREEVHTAQDVQLAARERDARAVRELRSQPSKGAAQFGCVVSVRGHGFTP